MAVDQKARLTYVSYKGGVFSGTRGLVEYLFGTNTLTWLDPRATDPAGPRRKRLYGSKQRTAARSGRIVYIQLRGDEGTYSGRYTGAVMDLVGELITKAGDKVESVYTARGSIYSKQFPKT